MTTLTKPVKLHFKYKRNDEVTYQTRYYGVIHMQKTDRGKILNLVRTKQKPHYRIQPKGYSHLPPEIVPETAIVSPTCVGEWAFCD